MVRVKGYSYYKKVRSKRAKGTKGTSKKKITVKGYTRKK